MIKCQFCHTLHVPNTIFCSECGNYLLEEEKRETDPLDTEDTRWMGENDQGIATSSQQDSQQLAIRLKIEGSKRQVEAPLDRAIHLGRVDPASNVFPEIDLTEDDVVSKSVSRRHVRILRQDNQVVVEDLGSVNGTFVNGDRLAPYLPEILSDGDTLQLGKLLIKVRILQRR
jgi:pSer/pThr/pTyr-binding forkhead associated (FHA) protein